MSDEGDKVELHRKGCVCKRCKMSGHNSAFTAKQVISREEWTRLGKPSTIESYLAALKAEAAPVEPADMVTLRGSNRAVRGMGPVVTKKITREEWERLGRPGTTHSYEEALLREREGPKVEADTIVIRGSVRHLSGDATKLTKEIPRSEWERLGRPRTIDRYQAALEAERK
jgi:hypothetical protein